MSGPNDSVAMNQVGEPDAGNPHVRFDERRLETGLKLPRQSSTLLNWPRRTGTVAARVDAAAAARTAHALDCTPAARAQRL
jgi:hypothetical protein